MLLPIDILNELPVACYFDDIDVVSSINEQARLELQECFDFGNASKYTNIVSVEDVFKNKDLLLKILEEYENTPATHIEKDTSILRFIHLMNNDWFSNFSESSISSLDDIAKISLDILKEFIEDKGGRNYVCFKTLESEFQLLYRAILNVLYHVLTFDYSPEVNNGNGPVDFKLSRDNKNIAIEFKKTSSSHIYSGLKTQLPTYMKANSSYRGIYVYFKVSVEDSKKCKKIHDTLQGMDPILKNTITLFEIDAYPLPSASKR